MASWKENKVIGVVAVIVVVIAIIGVVIGLQPRKNLMLLKCEQCGTEFETKVAVGTKFPIVCPKCNAQAAYLAKHMQCLKCGWTGRIIEKGTELKPLPEKELAKMTEQQKLARQKMAEGQVCPKCGARELKMLK